MEANTGHLHLTAFLQIHTKAYLELKPAQEQRSRITEKHTVTYCNSTTNHHITTQNSLKKSAKVKVSHW